MVSLHDNAGVAAFIACLELGETSRLRHRCTLVTIAPDIRMVEEDVRAGRQHLAEQRERIARLERHFLPSANAIEFLELLQSMQELHETHLARLLAKEGRNH